MKKSTRPEESRQGKTVFIVIAALALILPVPYFLGIQAFHLSGLPVYFLQMGLYLAFYLLAIWGLRNGKISLPVDPRMVLPALGWTLAGWLVYVLVLLLTGLISLPGELQTLGSLPLWKILAQILMTWFFVGLGEEVLFRGYFLAGIRQYFTRGAERRRTVDAVLLSSLVFSLWHIPVRIISFLSDGTSLLLLLPSLVLLFCMGVGFAYLFIRTRNILLVGLVHGVMDYSLIGMGTQSSLPTQAIILVVIVLAYLAMQYLSK